MDRLAMLREITDAPGLPGYECGVRQVMKKYLEPVAKVTVDRLGCVIGEKRGTSDRPRVMIAGHMDEIGFMVTLIEEDGFVRFQTIGGWLEQVLWAQRVTIHTSKGQIPGVIGSKPPHIIPQDERKKMVDRKEMFIDIGAKSRAEAQSWGVRPGDPIIPFCPFTPMHNSRLLMAKAWDDRSACALAIETLYELQGKGHPNTVYAVGTVQEEVGLRGAVTSSYVVDPDVGIALDVGLAGDMPGVKPTEVQSRLGKGPSICIYDSSAIPNIKLRDFVVDTAEQCGIPYQFDLNPAGGTDTGRIQLQGRGVPAICIGVPTRYIHTPASIMDLDDYENTLRLVVELVMRLDAKTAASFVG